MTQALCARRNIPLYFMVYMQSNLLVVFVRFGRPRVAVSARARARVGSARMNSAPAVGCRPCIARRGARRQNFILDAGGWQQWDRCCRRGRVASLFVIFRPWVLWLTFRTSFLCGHHATATIAKLENPARKLTPPTTRPTTPGAVVQHRVHELVAVRAERRRAPRARVRLRRQCRAAAEALALATLFDEHGHGEQVVVRPS